MAEFISSEIDAAVAVVTIDHPPVNALSAPLLEELEAELARLDSDDAVRAIVLEGAGERAFVAGADISEFPTLRESAHDDNGGSARGIQRLGHRMDAARTPFVAAIRGYCLGGGLEVAMCCDIRVAAEDAQLGQPEIKLGLIPGGGGTQRLPRFVGLGRAMLMNMTGDFVDARTAYEWGLVERIVPREEVHETALEIARTIAARSPVAIGVLRELARTTRDLPLEEGLRREAEGFRRCLASEDGLEGVTAFLEKREPRVHGALGVTDEGGGARRHGWAGEPRPPRPAGPRARRRPGGRRRPRGRDQLRGRAHPHRQLPADARAARRCSDRRSPASSTGSASSASRARSEADTQAKRSWSGAGCFLSRRRRASPRGRPSRSRS